LADLLSRLAERSAKSCHVVVMLDPAILAGARVLFAKVGERLLDSRDGLDDMLAPARAFMHLDDHYTRFETARVVVVPVPFDATTCYRPGTREGPQAIIDASSNLEVYDVELRRSPHTAGIATLRAVEPIMGNAQAMAERTERVTAHLLDQGKFVATLGGDHSISIGVIRAFAKRYPALSVLQIDAHADMRDEYEGNRLSSATIMRRTFEVAPRIGLVGIRSFSEAEAEFLQQRKIPVWLASTIREQTFSGRREWIDDVVAALGDEVYVTFDVDGFDPSLLPGTGTPEPGGLGWYEAMDLLSAVAEKRHIVGFDVVELSPMVEGHTSPVIAAKLVYKLIGLSAPTA
jgi:agmatinase